MSGAGMTNDASSAVVASVIALAGSGLVGLGVRDRPS
jgi:hypothetical protein